MTNETKLIRDQGVEPVTPVILPLPPRRKVSGGKGLVQKMGESLKQKQSKKKRDIESLKQESKAAHGNISILTETHSSKSR